ncbi:EAL domain-containing protein [Vibrio cincinnatiensis]|uniref:EAL domain-containing protein n=1 Tax=Vibrio cincinnatiensis TaxID=675 RepID=UPI0012AC7827|nr:EAL domain-containing protein [Vibrio cincinnatiensis]MCG3736623.1 EAL domain-containing protein [Vibrio cincinnatiensis]MCG3747095.1 EAL domain-containing protein [Vibrio cincinnatiensis]
MNRSIINSHIINNIRATIPFFRGLKFEPIVELDNLSVVAYEMLSLCDANIDVEESFNSLDMNRKRELFNHQLNLTNVINDKRVFINLPVSEILRSDFILEIKRTNIAPAALSIELQNLPDIYQFSDIELNEFKYQVKKLQALGVELWLDDLDEALIEYFFHLDVVFYGGKIDKTTFWSLRKNKKLLNFLIMRCNLICDKVLIEGIESDSDLKLIRATKADYAQGFYWPATCCLDDSADCFFDEAA